MSELAQRIRTLPREIEPQRDLFLQVRRRIEAEAPARGLAVGRPGDARSETDARERVGRWRDALTSLFPRPLAAAGVGATLMAATALVVFTVMTPPAGPLSDSEIAEIAAGVRERDGVAHVQAKVAALLETRREAIPPEALAAIEQSLRDIDRAIAEIHFALLENPEYTGLGYMLAEAYQREAQLLEQLEWWTHTNATAGGDAASRPLLATPEVVS